MKKNKGKEIITFIVLLGLLLSLNAILDKKEEQFSNADSKVQVVSNVTKKVVADIVTVPLTVRNIQMFEKNNEYSYKIKIDSNIKEYKYTLNNEEKLLLLDENKETTFTLKDNESMEIQGIPIDTLVEIEQLNDDGTFVDNRKFSGVTELKNEVLFYNSQQEVINPETADQIYVLLVLLVVFYIIRKIIKSIKVKKYENVEKC